MRGKAMCGVVRDVAGAPAVALTAATCGEWVLGVCGARPWQRATQVPGGVVGCVLESRWAPVRASLGPGLPRALAWPWRLLRLAAGTVAVPCKLLLLLLLLLGLRLPSPGPRSAVRGNGCTAVPGSSGAAGLVQQLWGVPLRAPCLISHGALRL